MAVFGAVLAIGLLNSRYNAKINLTIPIVFALVAVVWYAGRGPGLLLGVLFQATTIIYSTIPPDSSVAKAWFGYLSVFSLYVFLVLVISGLQNARGIATAQRDLLKTTLASIGDGVVATDQQGRVSFLNPVAEKMTGWSRMEAIGRPLTDVVKIINEETRAEVTNPAEMVLATGRVMGLANHSLLVSRNGREIPIEDSAAPIRDGERTEGVIFVFSDVTEKKLAERARRETEVMHKIVEAQEGERHRIARGLHDQLGQQMTALRLKVEALTDKCEGVVGLDEALADVQSSAVKLDRDIGFLSWELRPTELEELGLDNALRSFVREWANQHGVDAEFESRIAPGSRHGVEIDTNVYRITQEVLNSILKDSEASSVTVVLQKRGDELLLIIEDDGTGNREGITGVNERVELLKGTLDIDRSTDGTSMVVRIPFPRHLGAEVLPS